MFWLFIKFVLGILLMLIPLFWNHLHPFSFFKQENHSVFLVISAFGAILFASAVCDILLLLSQKTRNRLRNHNNIFVKADLIKTFPKEQNPDHFFTLTYGYDSLLFTIDLPKEDTKFAPNHANVWYDKENSDLYEIEILVHTKKSSKRLLRKQK